MGRNSVEATNACFSRAVRLRRSVKVPRWRLRRLEWAEWLVFLLVAFFVVVCFVEACFLLVEPDPSPESARPASGTAATIRQINPARQALLNLEGKNRDMRTLI